MLLLSRKSTEDSIGVESDRPLAGIAMVIEPLVFDHPVMAPIECGNRWAADNRSRPGE
jgi:hypothetical protein